MNYTNQINNKINNENNMSINNDEDVYLLIDQSVGNIYNSTENSSDNSNDNSSYESIQSISQSNSSSQSNISQSSECFICFENEINREIPFDINVLSIIYPNLKSCNCTGKIHIKCLYDWLKQSNTCPICRTPYNYEIVNHRSTTTIKTYSCLGIISFFLFLYLILSNTIPPRI